MTRSKPFKKNSSLGTALVKATMSSSLTFKAITVMITTLNSMQLTCRRLSGLGYLLGFSLITTQAFGLELTSGKWGINLETSSPMSATPASQYIEECIEDSNFDPLAMMQSEMAQQCKLTPHTNTATTLDADLNCSIPGAGSMTGKISFNVTGESATGSINMSMNVGGQQIQISNKWNGKYLGACK